MCSNNTWGEVSALNLPGWQHMIFFEREHGIQSPLLIIIIILCLQAAIAASEGVIVIRMWTKNSWGEQDSALNHPGWQHMIFFLKKQSFPCRSATKERRFGPTGAARAAHLCYGGWPESIDLTPKSKGGTCHCQRFVQSLVVLLRPSESDYCSVAKVPSTPLPRKLRLPESEANFRTFLVIAESNAPRK